MKKSEFLNICKECNALCCKLGGTNLTKEEVDKILKAGYKNNFKEITPGIFELVSNNDGVCPYLNEDNSCEIQEVKPIICSCWPVFPEFVNGKVKPILVNCKLKRIMSKEDIDKCKKEALQVSKKVAEITADESLIPKDQLEIINKRVEEIEEEE